MRIVFTSAAALAILMTALSAADERDLYQSLWRSDRFVQEALPDSLRPPHPPPTERDIATFQRYSPDVIRFTDIIARFGIPDRYLMQLPRRRGRWIVYDLPRGNAVGFYAIAPYEDGWVAGVIVDARGRVLHRIK